MAPLLPLLPLTIRTKTNHSDAFKPAEARVNNRIEETAAIVSRLMEVR